MQIFFFFLHGQHWAVLIPYTLAFRKKDTALAVADCLRASSPRASQWGYLQSAFGFNTTAYLVRYIQHDTTRSCRNSFRTCLLGPWIVRFVISCSLWGCPGPQGTPGSPTCVGIRGQLGSAALDQRPVTTSSLRRDLRMLLKLALRFTHRWNSAKVTEKKPGTCPRY